MKKLFYTLKAKSRSHREDFDVFKEYADYDIADAKSEYNRYPPGDAVLVRITEEDLDPEEISALVGTKVLKAEETMNLRDRSK